MWNCRGVVQGVLRLHIRCAVLNICWRTLPVRKICTFLKLHTHNLWHGLSVWPPHDIVWHFFLRLDKSHPEPQNTSYIYFHRVSSSPHGHDEYIDLYVWKWWSSSLKSPLLFPETLLRTWHLCPQLYCPAQKCYEHVSLLRLSSHAEAFFRGSASVTETQFSGNRQCW